MTDAPIIKSTKTHIGFKIFVAVYAIIAVFILSEKYILVPHVLGGYSVYVLFGDYVRFISLLSLPLFVGGVVLGFSIIGYGISIARKKESSLIVQILSPIIGFIVACVVIVGGAWVALLALVVNIIPESPGAEG